MTADDVPRPLQAERGAHWLRAGLIAWQPPAGAHHHRLHHAPGGGLHVDGDALAGGASVPLAPHPGGLPAPVRAQFPHLAAYAAFTLPADARRRAAELLTGELVVAAHDAAGALLGVTGLQIPGVLDDLYARAADAELGPVWRRGRPSLALWAPTATRVDVVVDPVGPLPQRRVPMRRGGDGVWRVTGEPAWRDAAYRYAVTVYVPALDRVVTNLVTDPYALALTANSRRAVLADLDDPALAPAGWQRLRKPAPAPAERTTIYELHVRDFSIGDATVPAAHRGTYLAFTHDHSDGMRHLRDLARAGMTHLHLLPTNDIATIEEVRAAQQEPPCDLPSLPPDSPAQQACVARVADTDGFNWGYDPLHYTAPEGSYATDPDGPARTRELRGMVGAVNRAGLRVVVDVVYNHTAASGQDPRSVLDRIVPGYYHRLAPATGAVETSTCCHNTATEHRMMRKLMVDSVVTWARRYKVDGFRFDLMGHHSRADVLAVRRALDDLTVARDGVDGRRILLYGEGWNFGEVADDARFVQATQHNLAGTGIATFSDRLRDAVRGGGPRDEDPRVQGFASGLCTDPNGAPGNGTPAQQRARLLHCHDLIKLGLAGNLRDYRFVAATGETVRGADVDHHGRPAGYAAEPRETITYVDAHDGETLFDALALKLPAGTAMADRVRMNTLALATTAFAQSPAFWHAGADLLRSKSLDRNSYDSGDWFNRIDWSGRESTFGAGLPPAADNRARWDVMRPLLADPALRPGPADIAAARAGAADLLRMRASTPLFHLGDARLVQERVTFPLGGPDQTPGVIVMAIDDRTGRDLDPDLAGLVVVFNAAPEETSQTVAALAGRAYRLHPVQAAGADRIVRRSTHDAVTGTFTVPARTVAVFVSPARTR